MGYSVERHGRSLQRFRYSGHERTRSNEGSTNGTFTRRLTGARVAGAVTDNTGLGTGVRTCEGANERDTFSTGWRYLKLSRVTVWAWFHRSRLSGRFNVLLIFR